MRTLHFTVALVVVLAALVMSCSNEEKPLSPVSNDGMSLGKGPAGPHITSISPASAEIGDVLTITGTNFGPKRGSGFWVTFNGIIATVYPLWSRTQIQVIVPSGFISGVAEVKVNVGTTTSNGVPFTLLPSSPVLIGSQTWMGCNLDVDRYRNGDPIPQVTDPAVMMTLTTGAWCYYNNDPAMGALYGKLYNWYAVNDPRGLAPAGWHVPTDGEWKTLSMFLGMSQADADLIGYSGTMEGGTMKETGTSLWSVPNSGATNLSGFTALPAGFMGYVNTVYACYSRRAFAGWWSSTPFDAASALMRGVYYSYSTTLRNELRNEYCLSVRCVQGD